MLREPCAYSLFASMQGLETFWGKFGGFNGGVHQSRKFEGRMLRYERADAQVPKEGMHQSDQVRLGRDCADHNSATLGPCARSKMS